jgi:hypothetical protein
LVKNLRRGCLGMTSRFGSGCFASCCALRIVGRTYSAYDVRFRRPTKLRNAKYDMNAKYR